MMSILSLWKRQGLNPHSRAASPAKIAGGRFGSGNRFEITLSGSGGQGVVLAGKILAEASSLYDAKEAVLTQSYGPEARGGASRVDVILDAEKIDYPKVSRMDCLLTLTQEALDKYGRFLSPEGLLIVDETFVNAMPPHIKHVFGAPFTSLAVKLFDTPLPANIMALGALAQISKAVSREALIRALLTRVPDKVLVLDRVALDAGFKIAAESGFEWEK